MFRRNFGQVCIAKGRSDQNRKVSLPHDVSYFFFSATVHISVVDINEYPPTFIEPSYVKQVDEGRLYNEIVRVEATDRDCTPKYGDVCKYEILTSDQPFTIDNEGKIYTERLNFLPLHCVLHTCFCFQVPYETRSHWTTKEVTTISSLLWPTTAA